jgi:signal transduction histidine kinase
MRRALRARDERMQMMLAGIAHEVRNPLGGLELYAGLLREGLAGQPERLAEIARVEREIGYLKNVVSRFHRLCPPPGARDGAHFRFRRCSMKSRRSLAHRAKVLRLSWSASLTSWPARTERNCVGRC